MGYYATLEDASGPIVVVRPGLVVELLRDHLHRTDQRFWHGRYGRLNDTLRQLDLDDPVAALVSAAKAVGFTAAADTDGSVRLTDWDDEKVPSFFTPMMVCLSFGVADLTWWRLCGEDGCEWVEVLAPGGLHEVLAVHGRPIVFCDGDVHADRQTISDHACLLSSLAASHGAGCE